jgi:hypothetical protein
MATSTGIRMTLTKCNEWDGTDGKHHRREEWAIVGGEIDPSWRRDADARTRAAGWEPSSRFTLYVIDGEVDPRLASYGGAVWPTAWTELFQARRQGTRHATVEITDLGLQFRSAALDGASDMYADARLS